MASVRELTAVYGNFMVGPRRGPSVCEVCFNLTDGYSRCYSCAHREQWLDAVCPISYSIGREQLHHALRGYKRPLESAAPRFRVELAAVLWRWLSQHESCVAGAAGTEGFQVVTTVPSGERARDEQHPLRRMVGELVGPTRDRHERLLERSSREVDLRAFAADKYKAVRRLHGESVLLVDDTWTTGANAQSAAAALKHAGAGVVAAVVIGRHLNREWGENDHRLSGIGRPFDWDRCALCGEPAAASAR